MMKKILFVIESLVCAGAEKSLVTLLNLMDYDKYEVDLQLFSYGGEFEHLLPFEVHVLEPLPYFRFANQSLKTCLRRKKTKKEKSMLQRRMAYSFALRTGKYTNIQKAVLFWKYVNNCFDACTKEYDVAIAYAQGTPTFYVADCIHAKKKYAWINCLYRPIGVYRDYIEKKYMVYDGISCVSDSVYEMFQKVFPKIAEKGTIIYDINDGKMIARMAEEASTAKSDMLKGQWKLLTVGRLAPLKGYEIAVEACRILKKRGIDFTWYVLGRGPLEKEIRSQIADKKIQEQFVLLGTKANPYPYFKEADIYVQTSRFEGFGLAIAEARMLNTPVVTTRFHAVYDQMVEGENGLVTDLNPEAVADAIQKLMQDRTLYEHIVEFQKKERKGNYEEMEKIYALIGEHS